MATVGNHGIASFNGTSASITLNAYGAGGQMVVWIAGVPSNMAVGTPALAVTSVGDNVNSTYRRIGRSYTLGQTYGLQNCPFGPWMTTGGLGISAASVPMPVTLTITFNQPAQGIISAMYLVPSSPSNTIAPDDISFVINQGKSLTPGLSFTVSANGELCIGGVAYLTNVASVPGTITLGGLPSGMTPIDNLFTIFNGQNPPVSTGFLLIGVITYSLVSSGSPISLSEAFNAAGLGTMSWCQEVIAMLDGTNVTAPVPPSLAIPLAVSSNPAGVTDNSSITGTLVPGGSNVPTVINLPLGS